MAGSRAGSRVGRIALVAAAFALAGCADGTNPFKRTEVGPATDERVTEATSVRLVDRDVEAPEVFQVTDLALWDGRPSLGGVWAASPDAVDPERVILRNTANGKFVIGALFRRERDNPGPKLQISSDAAAALGLLAGQPETLQVTALRREEGTDAAPDATNPILDAAETVAVTPLDTVAVATAALDEVDAPTAQPRAAQPALPTAPAAPVSAAQPAPAPAPGTGLIQVGIFSVEANAERAVATLGKAGITAEQRREETQGKAFWSVTARGGATTLASVKSAGFADAYVLKR